jgi:hypothetical protein
MALLALTEQPREIGVRELRPDYTLRGPVFAQLQ